MDKDPDWEDRQKRFAEYRAEVERIRMARLREMPWYKRVMFMTVGELFWDRFVDD